MFGVESSRLKEGKEKEDRKRHDKGGSAGRSDRRAYYFRLRRLICGCAVASSCIT